MQGFYKFWIYKVTTLKPDTNFSIWNDGECEFWKNLYFIKKYRTLAFKNGVSLQYTSFLMVPMCAFPNKSQIKHIWNFNLICQIVKKFLTYFFLIITIDKLLWFEEWYGNKKIRLILKFAEIQNHSFSGNFRGRNTNCCVTEM